MTIIDGIDESYLSFVSQLDEEDQRSLLAFYDGLVGTGRVIPYRIKDHRFMVNIETSQGFTYDIDFKDVLIEDGRHPKEIQMDSLSGEKTEDGRIRLQFINRLASAGEYGQVKMSAFSFSGFTSGISCWKYDVHTLNYKNGMQSLPWLYVQETFAAVNKKCRMLGIDTLNTAEKELMRISIFLEPYVRLYLRPDTQIGFGKSTVLFDTDAAEFYFDDEVCQTAAAFFDALALPKIAEAFKDEAEHHKDLIRELLYYMRNTKGINIYQKIMALAEEAGHDRIGLYENRGSRHLFRENLIKRLNDLFEQHGYSGRYPNYRRKVIPDFLEVSNVYSRRYAYLNEKSKVLYFDFAENIKNDTYEIIPVVGVIIPKQSSEEMADETAMTCFFTKSGRRNAEVLYDLRFTEKMKQQSVEEMIHQMDELLTYQEKQKGIDLRNND